MAYFKYISFELSSPSAVGASASRSRAHLTMPAFKAAETEAARRAGLAGLSVMTGEILSGLILGCLDGRGCGDLCTSVSFVAGWTR